MLRRRPRIAPGRLAFCAQAGKEPTHIVSKHQLNHKGLLQDHSSLRFSFFMDSLAHIRPFRAVWTAPGPWQR